MNTDRPSQTFFDGARVLVTGAAGTVGRSLVAALLDRGVARLRAVDNHEGDLYDLAQDYVDDPRLRAHLADVRQREGLDSLFIDTDLVFHLAALKHVELCERSPQSAVATNILGSQNVIGAALDAGVSRVLFTSSDKAVNPTSVMGTSKLMAERLFTSADALSREHGKARFAATRFGNVAGSRGSVVPTFCAQIAAGGPVRLTDPGMTRFVMTLDRAVGMVLEAMERFCGGEVFVTKMPVVRIADLASVLIDQVAPIYGFNPASVSIEEVGIRPGEKLYEELLAPEELRRGYEARDWFIVVPPFVAPDEVSERFEYRGWQLAPARRVYVSEDTPAISRDSITELLLEPGTLPAELAAQIAAVRGTGG